jgi:hypothetical protein
MLTAFDFWEGSIRQQITLEKLRVSYARFFSRLSSLEYPLSISPWIIKDEGPKCDEIACLAEEKFY